MASFVNLTRQGLSLSSGNDSSSIRSESSSSMLLMIEVAPFSWTGWRRS